MKGCSLPETEAYFPLMMQIGSPVDTHGLPTSSWVSAPGQGEEGGGEGGMFGDSERAWWYWGALRTQVSQRLTQPVYPLSWVGR